MTGMDGLSITGSLWHILLGVAFLLGVIAHLTIRPFEIDGKAWPIFFSYVGVLTILFVRLLLDDNATFLAALLRPSAISCGFNCGLGISILLYRAIFHRLRRFPGPFAARLSRFYAMNSAAKSLQANLDIQNLHQNYGDFVRVGPREISINRPSAITAVYGPSTNCTRSPWYSQVSDDITKISVNSTRDVEAHRKRKKVWERGLSFRALQTYEPRVASKVNLLLSRIRANAGKPTDMTETATFFGFDVMGDVGFSKDFHMLESGHKHPAIRGLHDNMAAVGVLGTVPWLMSMLSKIPGATGSYSRFTEWCGRELEAKRMSVTDDIYTLKDQDPRDVMSWLLKARDDNDEGAPAGEGAWQEDSRLMIIAGSDTTSVALTNALYFLTKYPACHRKLQKALDAEIARPTDWTYARVKSITYLDAIIYETLRLKPSVPAGLARLTPSAGLQVDEIFIPGDTIVSVPAYTIHRDQRYWGDDVLEFKPERWVGLSTDKAPWIPFTRGQYACPGKNLALMELRMVLSRIAMEYDMGFVNDDDAVAFDRDAKDTFTMSVPPLPLIFKRR